MGGGAAAALRARSDAAGDPSPDGAASRHDPQRDQQRQAAEVRARAGGVEAGSVQGRDPPAAARGPEAARSARPRADGELGFDGGKTIVDDYLREVRPLFAPRPRTFQRTVYRPGEVCQFDLWEPRAEVPVGHGQTRRGWVVIACLGYSRAGAGALIFSKQTPDLLAGIARCLWRLGALPQVLVWDRQAGLHARDGRPTEEFAALLRPAARRLAFLRAGRSAGQGRRRATAGLRRDQLRARPRVRQRARLPRPARRLVRARQARTHKTLRERPVDRLARELELMAPLPATPPDVDRRWVLRVPPDPHLRFDTNDYSLDPGLVGRRVEVRVSQREVLAVALDTGELACRHSAQLRQASDDHRPRPRPGAAQRRRRGVEPVVEIRPLARYDALIA